MPSRRSQLSICSWNVLAPSYHEEDDGALCWESVRKPALRAWLHKLAQYDVLCFQEAERDRMLAEMHDVLGPLGFHSAETTRHDVLVNATFFKADRFTTAWVERRSRVLLCGLYLKSGAEVIVINVHLEAGDKESQRVCQMRSALSRAAGHRAACTVVCGDFNSTLSSDSQLREMLKETGLVQAQIPPTAVTYSVQGWSAVLDHVWANTTVGRGKVLCSGGTTRGLELPDEHHPSDHLPVAATFEAPAADTVLLAALAKPMTIEAAMHPTDDIMQEWFQVLREAKPNLGKKAMKEQKRLQQAFLDVLPPEESAYLVQSKAWASQVAEAFVGMAVARATANARAQMTKAEETGGLAGEELWDPGGMVWAQLCGA